MKFSQEEKAMWLEDWRKSGKSAWAYAKENGLIPQTFCSWVKREGEKGSGFVEIQAYKKPPVHQLQEILIEKDDVKIHVPMSSWIEYPGAMKELIKAVL
jgi:transposase-like protein